MEEIDVLKINDDDDDDELTLYEQMPDRSSGQSVGESDHLFLKLRRRETNPCRAR